MLATSAYHQQEEGHLLEQWHQLSLALQLSWWHLHPQLNQSHHPWLQNVNGLVSGMSKIKTHEKLLKQTSEKGKRFSIKNFEFEYRYWLERKPPNYHYKIQVDPTKYVHGRLLTMIWTSKQIECIWTFFQQIHILQALNMWFPAHQKPTGLSISFKNQNSTIFNIKKKLQLDQTSELGTNNISLPLSLYCFWPNYQLNRKIK